MTQKSEQEGKLSLNRPGRLELKKTVETGQVRQSFSHGRSKSVMVEVKKKRTFGRDRQVACGQLPKKKLPHWTQWRSVQI